MTTTYAARPLDPATLEQLRAVDDSGHRRGAFVDPEGGAPLRCCLRRSRAGERLTLVSYAPLRRWADETAADPGAYDEQGPIFIHADDCGGPSEPMGYPFARPDVLRTVRCYDAGGRIAGGSLVALGEDPTAALDAAFAAAFADPAVALVHVRAVEHGCFQFEVRRP